MNMIPNYLDPYPDELLYSWIHRLAKANGLPVKDFIRTYLPGKRSYQNINPDIRTGVPDFYARIPHDAFPDVMSFVLSFSLLPFASLSMQDYLVARYVNNIFQPYNSLNNPTRGLFNKARVCPECMKEDIDTYGEPYLHRKHQLKGVCACGKHGIWLYQYGKYYKSGKIYYGCECDYDLNDYFEIEYRPALSDAAAYAEYACAVLGGGVVTDFPHVWQAILQRIAGRADAFETRFCEFFSDYEKWKHADLHEFDDISSFITRAHTIKGLRMDETMPMLMFLFPDSDDLIAELKKRGSVLKEYTCPVCGYEYCTSTENAWICPKCNRDASGEEAFAMLVDILGGGEYEILDPFVSMYKPVRMRHLPCDQTAAYPPLHFLYRGMRCSCGKSLESPRGSASCRGIQDA